MCVLMNFFPFVLCLFSIFYQRYIHYIFIIDIMECIFYLRNGCFNFHRTSQGLDSVSHHGICNWILQCEIVIQQAWTACSMVVIIIYSLIYQYHQQGERHPVADGDCAWYDLNYWVSVYNVAKACLWDCYSVCLCCFSIGDHWKRRFCFYLFLGSSLCMYWLLYAVNSFSSAYKGK